MKVRGIVAHTGYVESNSVGVAFFRNLQPEREFTTRLEAVTELAKTLFRYWLSENKDRFPKVCEKCNTVVGEFAKFCASCGSDRLVRQTETSLDVLEDFVSDVMQIPSCDADGCPFHEFYNDEKWDMYGDIMMICSQQQEDFIYIRESFEVLIGCCLNKDFHGRNQEEVKRVIQSLVLGEKS